MTTNGKQDFVQLDYTQIKLLICHFSNSIYFERANVNEESTISSNWTAFLKYEVKELMTHSILRETILALWWEVFEYH